MHMTTAYDHWRGRRGSFRECKLCYGAHRVFPRVCPDMRCMGIHGILCTHDNGPLVATRLRCCTNIADGAASHPRTVSSSVVCCTARYFRPSCFGVTYMYMHPSKCRGMGKVWPLSFSNVGVWEKKGQGPNPRVNHKVASEQACVRIVVLFCTVRITLSFRYHYTARVFFSFS